MENEAMDIAEQLREATECFVFEKYREATEIYNRLAADVGDFDEDERIAFHAAGLTQWAKMSKETQDFSDIMRYRDERLERIFSTASCDDVIDVFRINNDLGRYDDNLRLYDRLKENARPVLTEIWETYGLLYFGPFLIAAKRWDEIEKHCDLEKDFAFYIQGSRYFDENELDAYEKYASHLQNHKILKSIDTIRRNGKMV